jgi:hypothetical protein
MINLAYCMEMANEMSEICMHVRFRLEFLIKCSITLHTILWRMFTLIIVTVFNRVKHCLIYELLFYIFVIRTLRKSCVMIPSLSPKSLDLTTKRILWRYERKHEFHAAEGESRVKVLSTNQSQLSAPTSMCLTGTSSPILQAHQSFTT